MEFRNPYACIFTERNHFARPDGYAPHHDFHRLARSLVQGQNTSFLQLQNFFYGYYVSVEFNLNLKGHVAEVCEFK